jgi:hypothetical protein
MGEHCSQWASDGRGRILIGEDGLVGPRLYVTASTYRFDTGTPVWRRSQIDEDLVIVRRRLATHPRDRACRRHDWRWLKRSRTCDCAPRSPGARGPAGIPAIVLRMRDKSEVPTSTSERAPPAGAITIIASE